MHSVFDFVPVLKAIRSNLHPVTSSLSPSFPLHHAYTMYRFRYPKESHFLLYLLDVHAHHIKGNRSSVCTSQIAILSIATTISSSITQPLTRSAKETFFCFPPASTNQLAGTFLMVNPLLWNSLPRDVRLDLLLRMFHQQVKTELLTLVLL